LLYLFSENIIYFTYNKHSEEAENIVSEKKNIFAIKCDFTNYLDVIELEKTIPTLDLDVLVNNAYVGSPQDTYFHKTNPETIQKSFENNILPTIRITQIAISRFRKKSMEK